MTKNKILQHIKKYTIFVGASLILDVNLTETNQISCKFKKNGITSSGEIQKIYLDEEGEAIAYDVYVYIY